MYYVLLYKQNIGWSYYATYTYNTNKISDGHIMRHTLITQTEYLMVILGYIHL